MKKEIRICIKDFLINLSVFLTILLGSINLFISYNHRIMMYNYLKINYAIINPQMLSIHRVLSVIIGFALIVISYRLFKRMRMAWLITICILSSLVFINIIRFHGMLNQVSTIEIFVILVLSVYYKDFKKRTDPLGLKKGLLMGLIVSFLTLLNTCFTIYILHVKILRFNELNMDIRRTLKTLLYMDPTFLGKLSRSSMIFIDSSIIINWVGIIGALIFIMKPLIYQPIVTSIDHEKVRKLLRKYADNPISYVAVENDKKYYFGKNVEGVITYTIAAGVAVCPGDPICAQDCMAVLLSEFIIYCKQNDFDICFCQTLERNIPIYKEFGFGFTKYGEEAMFDLVNYNLSGGRAAKIRNAVNHATALGITVIEYKPLEKRDIVLEKQIYEVSKEWLKNKKSSELSFMIGTISLDNPMDRRYFVAYDNESNMLGFIVFSPFLRGKGFVADVTRRRKNAPIGVMEKSVIEAFNSMKAEGLNWGSLGLAPLVNAGEDGGVVGKGLGFIYENLNNFYGFKSLHHYKKKYGPSVWETRYIVYRPNVFSPKIAYSIIKAQNPKGVSDFIIVQLKTIFSLNN
jgi:phosphatidylglycerol lysyltransferase